MFESQITLEELMSKVSSFDIFTYYCPNFKQLGKPFCSEFRPDKNPSCNIKMWKGDLLYKDFGNGDGFRAIDYVMYKYNLGFNEAINKIYGELGCKTIQSDFNDTSSISYRGHNCGISNSSNSNSIIRIKKRDYTTKDIEYWSRFYWTEDMLKMSKTYSISHYWINDVFFNVENELGFSYDYYEHNGIFRRKLYFPERSDYKWFSNVDNSIVQLVDVAPKSGDVLFITSSKKDAGVFWRMQIENMFPDKVIHGVAPNNESSFVPEEWYNKMKTRWKHIAIWYNNDWNKSDNPGIKYAKKYSEMYNIPYYYNPDNEPKDPSDFVKKYDLLTFKNLVNELCRYL